MTPQQYQRKTLSAVCSLEAYQWLEQWIKDRAPSNRYPLPPEKYFYSNTKHRQYLSKFIESVIILVLRNRGCDPIRAKDTGKSVDRSQKFTDVAGRTRVIGGRTWIKDKDVRAGRADLVCFIGANVARDGKAAQYNLEVKVGKDRQSIEQSKEQQRALLNGERYEIIKTVDDFLNLIAP